MISKKEILCAFFIPLLYLVTSIATIGDYGVNIDEPAHFRRGQGYLHYFLTGKKDYKDLPATARRSHYQDNFETGGFYIDVGKDQSHPPLNDTLSALTNYVFYQKLNVLGDVESHHLFGILTVTLLLFGIYVFTRIHFGIFAGIVAALSVFLYPIFLGESHFNVKDPPQASFYGLTIILLWFGIFYKKAKYIIAASVFCALALGTKFNIVFLPFIVIPWLLSYGKKLLQFPKRIYLALLISPLIVFSIFLLTNPNLWVDTQTRIYTMIQFYLSSSTKAGGSPDYQPAFLFFGFNTYPFLAVLYSIPLPTLLFLLIGIFVLVARVITKRDSTSILLLFWFSIPILRMSLPGTTIYGGIRHIFEFIPAMGILAGTGASILVSFVSLFLYNRFQKANKKKHKKQVENDMVFKIRFALQIFILLSFIPITLKIISIHPNENVYFNPLIGGLKGAYEKNFPYAGVTVGNTYLQGAKWLNIHSEKNSCVSTPLAHSGNIPPGSLRKDIEFRSGCQSNLDREGEYAMDMVYKGYFNEWYAYAYYTAYLYPVHEIKVDDVIIFQIFKNDISHSKKEFIKEASINPEEIIQDNNKILITLPKSMVLSRLNIAYDLDPSCEPVKDGYVVISNDGKLWKREPDNINVALGKELFRPHNKRIERKFAAKKMRYIHLITDLAESCTMRFEKVEVFYHPDAVR